MCIPTRTNHDCFDKYSNKGGLNTPCKSHRTTVPDTDKSLAPAVVLSPTSTPPVVREGNQTQDNSSDEAVRNPVEAEEFPRNVADPNGPDQPARSERETAGDLPGTTITGADLKLDTVYGDHVQQNIGQHLDGGIANDPMWQNNWSSLVVFPSKQYNTPTGPLGRRVIETVARLVDDVHSRIDARNAFNELNQTVMLWTIRHEWPSGARFTFNCYKHYSILVIRGNKWHRRLLIQQRGRHPGRSNFDGRSSHRRPPTHPSTKARVS
jgi:hypothetical protein